MGLPFIIGAAVLGGLVYAATRDSSSSSSSHSGPSIEEQERKARKKAEKARKEKERQDRINELNDHINYALNSFDKQRQNMCQALNTSEMVNVPAPSAPSKDDLEFTLSQHNATAGLALENISAGSSKTIPVESIFTLLNDNTYKAFGLYKKACPNFSAEMRSIALQACDTYKSCEKAEKSLNNLMQQLQSANSYVKEAAQAHK